MNFDETLEYLSLDNIVQWHLDNPNQINTKKINERIIELQQKFLKPYVIVNTEKSE